MRCEIRALHEGAIDFAEFYVSTESEWTRLARYLIRRWAVPAGVDVEDVRQELIAAAWAFIDRYDPDRAGAATIDRFVIFNACDKAKKWLHKQRAAKRRHDDAPSRHAMSFSDLVDPAFEEAFRDGLLFDDPEPEMRMQLVDLLARLPPATARVVAMLAEEGFDARAVGDRLAHDTRYRVAHRLGDAPAVHRHVNTHIKVAVDAATAA